MECGWKKNTVLHLTIWMIFANMNADNIQTILGASGRGNINDDYHALLIACARGEIDTMSDLLYTCLEVVDWQDNDGRTILHHACKNGHVDVVRALLSVFPRVDIVAESGHTAMELAEFNGYVNIPPHFQNCLITTEVETAVTEAGVVESAVAEAAFTESTATTETVPKVNARTANSAIHVFSVAKEAKHFGCCMLC
jgi:hypothetical protein